METEDSGGDAGVTFLLSLDDWRRHSRCAVLMRVCVASLTRKIKQNLSGMSSVLSVSNIPINHISVTAEAVFQRLLLFLSQMFEEKQISIGCCAKKKGLGSDV